MNGRTKAKAILTLAAAILYLLWIMDLIPDFIPVAGYLDDIAVISTAAYSFITGRERFRRRDDTDNSPWREVEP